ncbi:hypothetical protein [Flavobacterium difficile]|uniref:hypothetical protein n=1 Tax=Flavobacterium difficile TaxID=2709659 RepID=UPI001F242F9C|nr:hypothetical protein [Flavobacterium difficile]
MNYITHLTTFFEKVLQEPDFKPMHISLYLAMFQSWNKNRFQNPIAISRNDMIRISKIGSPTLYENGLKKLDEQGYIKYQPSGSPFKPSLVHVLELTEGYQVKKIRVKTSLKIEQVAKQVVKPVTEPVAEQALIKHCASTEQALVSYININKHYKHNKTIYGPQKNINGKNENSFLKNSEKEEKKLREKKKLESEFNLPILENVISFFQENNYSRIEATTFFNSFEKNGWLVGEPIKMENWKAAAQNWMLHQENCSAHFRNPEPASVAPSRSVEAHHPMIGQLDTQNTLPGSCTTFEETFEDTATGRIYHFNRCVSFLTYQGKKKFGQAFKICESDYSIVQQLLVYAIRDEKSATKLNINLNKGILLSGKIGCGKTAFMHLLKPFFPPKFAYKITTCREVSFAFAKKGSAALEIYTPNTNHQNRLTGYCFDDFGSEQHIKQFGHDSNVIAKIIMSRYAPFVAHSTVTHLTTHLSMLEIETLYGSMFSSKILEMFNVIAFSNESRDK